MGPDEFRFSTGTLATDFVATVGQRLAGGRERLSGPDRLAEWLTLAGLCPPGTLVTETRLDHARLLREAAYRLMRARMGDGRALGSDVDLVNSWARHRPPVPQLSGPDFRVLVTAKDPVRSALAAVASDVVRLLTGPAVALLRSCQSNDCGMMFLDHSQTRGRRWCSMRECGNRAKVAAHRARRRTTEPHGAGRPA